MGLYLVNMMKIQIPKGLFDILPYGDSEKWRLISYWQSIESIIQELSKDYGFHEIRTPVFERTELFDRGVGEQTDIVSKEMYTFEDKAKRSLSLRPEGTSSIMRAFVEKKLYALQKIHKLYYVAPMFRYERPQAGRYRQHHQFGVEAIGSALAEQDVEVIDMLWEFFSRIGLTNLTLHLNTIGDSSCKKAYISALKSYLTPYLKDLSVDSQTRFEKNPLRILDSKDKKDIQILQEAPTIQACLSADAKKHFEKVCTLLDEIQIPFILNPKIVRGLDYYSRTVFEISTTNLGAQNSLGGGGRYDGFTAMFGGPSLPGVGFGSGIERIIQAMIFQKISPTHQSSPFVFLIPLAKESQSFCFSLLARLRHANLSSEMDFSVKKIQQSLQRANSLNACYCLILGDSEWEAKQAKLKDMQTGKESVLPLEKIESTLIHLREKQ